MNVTHGLSSSEMRRCVVCGRLTFVKDDGRCYAFDCNRLSVTHGLFSSRDGSALARSAAKQTARSANPDHPVAVLRPPGPVAVRKSVDHGHTVRHLPITDGLFSWRKRRRLKRIRCIQADYERLTDREKADHYWRGRGL